VIIAAFYYFAQVGYVEQMDIHSPSATVEEALWFSGRLRLPPSVSNAQVSLVQPLLFVQLQPAPERNCK
jgi:ABC-type multidrug transport system ATPase subunit